MEFRTVVVAAVVLVVASTGSLAAYQLSDQARSEAAQTTIERTDSLAVELGIVQFLVSDDDHDPTAYGDSVTVTYNGTTWSEGTDYQYYNASGELEFLRDEPDEADIEYIYEVPENQVADDQLQTLTVGTGQVLLVAVGLSFVVLLLFVGRFVAKRMGVGNQRLQSNR